MINVRLVATRERRCHAYPVRIHWNSTVRTGVAAASGTVLLTLAGCATPGGEAEKPRPSITAEPQTKADIWQGIATDADKSRIERLGIAWQEGLEEARRSSAREVDAEGALLKPRSALARPAPTPGSYYCRLVKLGRTAGKGPALEKFKPFFCYVEVDSDLLTIVKQTGSQRPAGRLWE